METTSNDIQQKSENVRCGWSRCAAARAGFRL